MVDLFLPGVNLNESQAGIQAGNSEAGYSEAGYAGSGVWRGMRVRGVWSEAGYGMAKIGANFILVDAITSRKLNSMMD